MCSCIVWPTTSDEVFEGVNDRFVEMKARDHIFRTEVRTSVVSLMLMRDGTRLLIMLYIKHNQSYVCTVRIRQRYVH